MHFTIIDGYTDEPSGLGVPPYLGTYPRYIVGAIKKLGHTYTYLTIDDLRTPHKPSLKTDITTYNRTGKNPYTVLETTNVIIVNSGVHTPGKYLSALPATLKEITSKIAGFHARKILTGPAAEAGLGSGLYGGKIAHPDFSAYDLVAPHLEFKLDQLIKNNFVADVFVPWTYEMLREISLLGAELVEFHPSFGKNLMVEIETSTGCSSAKCSFCTEPIKNKFTNRKVEDIVREVQAVGKFGVENFRLGKQADFFARPLDQMEEMLKTIVETVHPRVLHIDNVNPQLVTDDKVKLLVRYCTEGNIAAFGAETFDPVVTASNTLNSPAEVTYKAVQIINKYGKVRGPNGMPRFLPGINILFGLKDESKKTHEHNMYWLKRILEEDLWLRRINIRQVVAFPGTKLYEECKTKFVKKNKRYYYRWRHDIREKIDNPMLKKIVPFGAILSDVYTEVYDGNTTFGRQIGTYPLIVGMKGRLPLNKRVTVRVVGHMLRSIVGEVVE